jgi:SAM-dependent methyltransferase
MGFNTGSLALRLAEANRARKFDAFMALVKPTAETSVLDVGFTGEEYREGDNYLEKHYPYREQITALGIDATEKFVARYPEVRVVTYDGRRFPFRDQEFDVCWSNAVLEHVGDRARQVLFLQEVRRVAKRAFVTTPNKHFPVELHTRTPLLHNLPAPLFEKYLAMTGKAWATGDYMKLLSLKDVRELLGEAGISGYSIIKNRLGAFIVDMVIVMDEAPSGRASPNLLASHV